MSSLFTPDAKRITLVGMSGSGKSYWSRKLEEQNFRRFPCDDLIARKLFPELTERTSAIRFLGDWMGFPYRLDYKGRESKYLKAEIEVLAEIIEYLRSTESGSHEKVVIDSTGSVIYSGEDSLQKLQQLTIIVHLATPSEIQGKMLKAYLARPRPVLWRGMYKKDPEETSEQAIARCYPILLSTREHIYQKYAHVTIDYYQRNRSDFSVDELLAEVEAWEVSARTQDEPTGDSKRTRSTVE